MKPSKKVRRRFRREAERAGFTDLGAYQQYLTDLVESREQQAFLRRVARRQAPNTETSMSDRTEKP